MNKGSFFIKAPSQCTSHQFRNFPKLKTVAMVFLQNIYLNMTATMDFKVEAEFQEFCIIIKIKAEGVTYRGEVNPPKLYNL